MSKHTYKQDERGQAGQTGLRKTAREFRAEGHVQKDVEQLLQFRGEEARPCAVTDIGVLHAQVLPRG